MLSMQRSGRPAQGRFRAAILVPMLGLGGCFPLPPNENIADAYGEFAGFCGFLQDCGSHSDGNRGGNQTRTGSSDESSSSSPSTGTEPSTEPSTEPDTGT
jgi:hypothetical protein